jgi:cytosine/adenosine deaminase-related metal-dependent hydrolase
MFTSVVSHLTRPEEIQTAFNMPRNRAARALNLVDYGIIPGTPANLVLLAATDAQEALQLQPAQRIVFRNGVLVSNLQEKRAQ